MLIRRRPILTDCAQNFLPQLPNRMRVPGKLIDSPRQRRRRGVTSGEEDCDDLVAQELAVAGEAGKGVEEVVALVFVLGLGGEFGGGEAQGTVDVEVYEAVDGVEAGPEFCFGDEAAEFRGAGYDVLDVLDTVKSFGELIVW